MGGVRTVIGLVLIWIAQKNMTTFVVIATMYYTLSNMAEKELLEQEFNVRMAYPNLYRRNPLINGLKEEHLSIITSERQDEIVPAIWGMLPENYMEDWVSFQNVTNTLNLNEKLFDTEAWYTKALVKRKCLVLVTGFFTSYLRNGDVYPFHVGLASEKPFALAGIYNRLQDGFLTCSIITTRACEFIQKIQNIGTTMPLILPKEYQTDWLGHEMDTAALGKFASLEDKNELKARPIAKEFFKNNIVYDSLLEPIDYKNLPEMD